ncbi:hypothetical protein [Streptomyces sp. HUAS ZL42]|uniref:hypothetical protein n=1 Tax=Streptomyces sp. HUAS ZL42 TaxID=3231715 RepID=UPI00345EC345
MTTLSTFRTPTNSAPLPVLRAAVFAVVGTVLGACAHHVVAEGPAPWRQGLVAVTVLFGVGLVGTRRPRSLTTVVATCGAAQTGLHLWLTTAHSSPGAAPTTLPGHLHHGACAQGGWHGRLRDYGSLTMTAVHAVAAVLVAVLLHRADTVCWSLARGLTTAVETTRARIATIRALLRDRPLPTPSEPNVFALAWLERPPPMEAVLAVVVLRRGPPQAGFTFAI